jgi:hypothetical protein
VKTSLFLLLLLSTTLALAQDCFFCVPSYSWVLPQAPNWPVDLVDIENVSYERNSEATFCKRPEEMIDTIVLHHSETPSTDSPERLNEYHLARGESSDPWYMIGYSYVINSPYPGAGIPRSRVTEGRPLNLVGAHAGSNIFVPMDDEQKKMWDEGKVICGKESTEFSVDPSLIKDGRIKANVTTLGLVVTGNYSPFSKTNPNGYSKKNPRYPTAETQDLAARLSCQLQKRYPRIKNIKWHSFYHSTSCPGSLKNYIGQIKALARKYGCEFN